MRNYIILNGKNSNEINGLLIQELPPISKPLIRTEVEEIDGRDGDIVTPLGYSAYDKEFTIGLYKDFDVNEVAAYFNSEGTVIFSNEPDKYYYYQITAQIDFERLVRYRTATVTMHCQPFKYSATEQPITEDVSGTVSDEGTNLALENTAEAPFNTLDLKGNTSQQTYSGKNLFKLPASGTANGVTFTNNGDGTFNISGTPTAHTEFSVVMPLAQSGITDGQSYTLSSTATISSQALTIYVHSCSSIGAWNKTLLAFTSATTLTSPSPSTEYVKLVIVAESGRTVNFSNAKLQLEKGSSATDFEPYAGGTASPNPDYPQAVQTVTGENVVKITGKNLYDGSISETGKRLSTSTGGSYTDANYDISSYIPVQPNTTYTINTQGRIFCDEYTDSKTFIVGHAQSYGVTDPITITTASTARYIRFDFPTGNASVSMLELGSSASSYEPYQEQSYPISLGSIELCGLGDDGAGGYLYQDGIYKNLTDNKWYVRKEVGKLVQNGTETGWYNLSGSTSYARTNAATSFVKNVPFFANRGLTTPTSGTRIKIPNNNLYWYETGYESIEAFKSSLATTNLIVYAPLLTPTDTEITNEALIEQLDNIYYHAHAYKGRTHITSSAATGNVPHIIAAEVGEDNESTITNAGNYLSKPKITVYGSGDISLYINDMHVLQITLGDEGYITIDTAQMEAYKDTLDNLKNRLVIGDYSNARLKPGANKIHFTGTVTKYVVENYSRWL